MAQSGDAANLACNFSFNLFSTCVQWSPVTTLQYGNIQNLIEKFKQYEYEN